MRKLVAILWTTALLAWPAYAAFHGHMIGHTDGGCLACHLSSSPAAEVEAQVIEPRPVLSAEVPVQRPRIIDLDDQPLSVAPKTSPPAQLFA